LFRREARGINAGILGAPVHSGIEVNEDLTKDKKLHEHTKWRLENEEDFLVESKFPHVNQHHVKVNHDG